VTPDILSALTGFVPHLVPEIILGVVACVLFLGATWKASRDVWGAVALAGLAAAGVALWLTATSGATLDSQGARLAEMTEEEVGRLRATVFASPVQHTNLALLFKVIALAGGAVLLLFSWDEVPADHTAEYHGCLLLIVAGMCLTGTANDLITLFLALELVSIPTYVMLYLPRADGPAQEAAMKYFLLSIFSSGLLLFGFSYLYGVCGTTNLPALAEALVKGRGDLAEAARGPAPWQGLAVVALVMVVAGLGFRITAVPFHFYAPDVYQGTTTGMAALLAFAPKVAGFAALLRVLGFVAAPAGMSEAVLRTAPGLILGEQVPVLLWIMAAVTMSLGNILALLQDNVRRLLAYSSVAHAGYMLIGLTVAPRVLGAPGEAVGGVEALLFYLVAYGAMTVGAFAVLHYVSTPGRRVETVDDLAGLGRSHPGVALVMALFLFSLIGIPLTAGFVGKFLLFFEALGVSRADLAGASDEARNQAAGLARLYVWLAVIGVLNAAVGAWYYLRIAAVMYLREPLQPLRATRAWSARAAIGACAVLTLALGVYPGALLKAVQAAVPRPPQPAVTSLAAPAGAVADGR
jgi:NADH-quinone oxidoreductase subunit N